VCAKRAPKKGTNISFQFPGDIHFISIFWKHTHEATNIFFIRRITSAFRKATITYTRLGIPVQHKVSNKANRKKPAPTKD
jgi:hypothetical protein